MEFMAGGNLMTRTEKHKVTDADGAHIVYQILQAIEYLHERSIVHRNINMKSILVEAEKCIGDPPKAKLADFSYARFFGQQEDPLLNRRGLPLFMAPEMIKGEPYD